MLGNPPPLKLRGLALILGLAAAVVAPGCAHSKVEPLGADAGQPCQQAGQSLTGCLCSAEQLPGYRRCGPDLIWSPCTCPPAQPAQKCVEGQDVLCDKCPGESVGRMTKCLSDGTFDCACQGSGGQHDAGQPGARDAGTGRDMDGG